MNQINLDSNSSLSVLMPMALILEWFNLSPVYNLDRFRTSFKALYEIFLMLKMSRKSSKEAKL